MSAIEIRPSTDGRTQAPQEHVRDTRRCRIEHPLQDDLVELIAERFRALGEPTRIKLLDRLREGEATVQELTEVIGSTQQNVSKHLGVLRQAGIVRRRREGNYVHYWISDEGVFALCEDVCGSLRRQVDALRDVVGSEV